MYRYVINSQKSEDGIGFHKSTWSECLFKWSAIRCAKKGLKEDKDAFHAYVEDISGKFWNDETCSGKIVWEASK